MSEAKQPYPKYIYNLLVKERDGYLRSVMRDEKDFEGRKAEIRRWDEDHKHDGPGPGFGRPRTPTRDRLGISESNLRYLDEVLKYFAIHFMEEPSHDT